jgi:hypothetical protein
LVLTAVTVFTIISGCVYPTFDGDVNALEEQQSVWQYLKVYSIFHDRLPQAPGSMTPYDMFIAINDSLGGGRYTEYMDDRPGGGVIFDPNTVFEDPLPLTDSTVYYQIPEFSDTALWLFQRSMRTLSRYPNIIIDVRDNGGGLLSVTNSILSELLPFETPYIKARYREYNRSKYIGETLEDVSSTSKKRPELLNKKIAVLMNGYSASASEILAAGLKDGADAYLVGSKSYGKGIGQVIITREGRKRISITFLEISGISERTGQYHRKGIAPDEVPTDVKSYVDEHIPNARQQEIIQAQIEEIQAEYPNIPASYIRQILVNEFREMYYALKMLEPDIMFTEDDDDDDDDVVDGGSVVDGMRKSRSDNIGEIAARIHRARERAKAKWRPMGAVIVDEKDLPRMQ